MIDGLTSVLKRLNGIVSKAKAAQMSGLMAAGLFIEGKSKKVVPVHKGKLRASGYTRKESERSVVVGYSAKYARAVHEKVDMKWKGKPRRDGIGVYWGPNGQAKYLEQPFRQNLQKVVSIVRTYTVVGNLK